MTDIGIVDGRTGPDRAVLHLVSADIGHSLRSIASNISHFGRLQILQCQYSQVLKSILKKICILVNRFFGGIKTETVDYKGDGVSMGASQINILFRQCCGLSNGGNEPGKNTHKTEMINAEH